MALYDFGRVGAALMSFGRAAGIKQGDGEARRGRGWALRDRNRYREALE